MALPFLLKAKNTLTKVQKARQLKRTYDSAKTSENASANTIFEFVSNILKSKIFLVLMSNIGIVVLIVVACVVIILSVSIIPNIVWGVDFGGSSNNNSSTVYTDYLQWAIDIANDDSHGYSQCARTGPDYDCSSLVYYSLLNSGYTEDQLGGSYPFTTYTMDGILTNIGFERHSYNEADLQAGDILWRSSHTGIYAGNGQVVQASSSRQGSGLCGDPGDQDGTEIWISGNLGNWTAFYRKSS